MLRLFPSALILKYEGTVCKLKLIPFLSKLPAHCLNERWYSATFVKQRVYTLDLVHLF